MSSHNLESNRVRDLGQTVRPSSKFGLLSAGVIFLVLLVFAVVCQGFGLGARFELFALLYVLSGQWELPMWGWLAALVLLVLSAGVLVACRIGVKALVDGRSLRSGSAVTRVDSYAKAMGHGAAVSKVSRERAEDMAAKLVKGYDPKQMQPGLPLGTNIVDRTACFTSWEDMSIVLAGPRSGKSLCYAIPAVLSAPGPVVATSNKGDILDTTRPVRERNHGHSWVFDPERIAEPTRVRTPWVWPLIDSVKTMSEAKRIADCWRYASGQAESGGDDYFPGTAARQVTDYLFAAHLGGCDITEFYKWVSDATCTTPADILGRDERYKGIAERVNGVLGLVEETRSGVFGSMQTMCAFLGDPEIVEWVQPLEGDGKPGGRPIFDPYDFATSDDTLYLLSAQGRPSTALTASLTAVVAFTAFQRAQAECQDNNRRLPIPLTLVLDEAYNICRWPELPDVYSYFGSAGIVIMTIWQNPAQGEEAFGKTHFDTLFNNANILVYLGGIKDAKFLSDLSQLVGQRELVRGNVTIDGKGHRSVNNTIQSEDILPVSRLAEWPVGRALVLGSQARAQIVSTIPWTANKEWVAIIDEWNGRAS
ncbi:type IV secretion system protein VirD4 [Bifidobacterium aemilianum]|uniref:Type IV secretion system protein VirD4 n=1 Tax=Bifidobacterium aemilianum TaxID=2493120 RepID=A0A366K971_9BIFI|nr:type IV secretory system conjugative DNA transfer family protein [Bifidobacterium aemilianum]RBP97867.1 type IV secretion system protein VirD4 [Bifidobacterium aemilianum]